MAFDDNLILRDGTADLQTAEAAALVLTADANGAKVLDIRKTGQRGLAAVLVLPTAPTAFADTLDVTIEHSRWYDDTDAFDTLVTFARLYAIVYRVRGTATVAFDSDDILQTLTSTDTSDELTIIDYDKALETVGGIGDVIGAQVAADDVFDQTDGDTCTSGGGGTMTQVSAAAVRTKLRSYGVYVVRFHTDRQYIRALFTASAGSNFGKVECLISNSPYLDL